MNAPILPRAMSSEAEARPIRLAILYLAGLGAFFYASYGFTNWVASLRSGVPSIVFSWEAAVPFMAWTIVPYWTTNLFYATSLLFTRTRHELEIHARRLLTAQIVAVTFFLLLPLKFSWPKPETSGFFGFFFEALGAFDKPFNQAPSLHVALTAILIARFERLLPRPFFMAFLAWSVLVVASVMTTFQHHFIDIPTGAALGFFCLWLWREDGTTPFRHARLTGDGRRLRLARNYAAGALMLGVLAIGFAGSALWLLWPTLSLAMVSAGYAWIGPALFMKDETGRIAWPARLLLLPYLLGAWINSRLWTRRDADRPEVADGVHLGRFPSAADAASFARVIDLTAEMPSLAPHEGWATFPMLDLVAPEPRQLSDAAFAIDLAQREGGPVLVCCALGYGRSVAALAVWLVRSGRAPSLDAAMERLRQLRPRLNVNADQRKAMEAALHEG